MSAALGAVALLALLLIQGGCDNPACLFNGSCGTTDNGAGGSLGATAEAPIDGELILAGAPRITSSAPNGMNRHSETPVVIVFNETMAPDTVTSAFEILRDGTTVPVMSASALAGDGRVLVLLPNSSLPEGSYSVQVRSGETPSDLGGQLLDVASLSLPEFTVPATNPTTPAIVTLFPPNSSTNHSSTTEVVCVFDRNVDPPVDLAAGWDVVVRPAGGMDAPPAFDPVPLPLEVVSFLGIPITDNRVWTWRSVDGTEPQRLQTSGGQVTVQISPAGNSFFDADAPAQIVAPATTSFTLSAAPRPRSGLLNPGIQPQDAIGISNLDGLDMARDLTLQVDFEADDLAQPGDVLTVFFFGTDPADAMNTIAFQRSITLAGAGPLATAMFTRAELDLASSTFPLSTRVDAGAVRFALRLERGADQGYLKLLDVDLVTPDVQDPILDTDPPSILRFDTQGMLADAFASDMADLVVAGFADVEPGDFIRGAEVVSTTGAGATNVITVGVVPEVLGSAPALLVGGTGPTLTSAFLASPVAIGKLAPAGGPLDVIVTVFDRALNASAPSPSTTWRQRGVVGNTLLDETDPTPLVVEVFDSESLFGLAGAKIYAHAEVDDGFGNLSYVLLGAGPVLTGASGVAANVPHHNAAQERTVVTVELPGYDVFTFHGVPTTRLSIPLTPSLQVLGTESNSLLVDSTSADVSTFVRRVGDSRRVDTEWPTVATLNTPGTTTFDFSVGELRPFRLGAQSFVAGILDAQIANVSKDRLLKAFELRIPVNGQETVVFSSMGAMTVDRLLDAANGPPEDVPKAVADVQLTAEMIQGMNPENLIDDFHYDRQPLIEVEATLPGIDRPLPVGLGTAYDVMGNARRWNVRSAFAGAVDPTDGALKDVFDPDLRLRAELRAEDSLTMLPAGVSGIRPRLTDLATLDPLRPPDVPAITSIPTDGTGTLMSQGFDLTFTDTINAATGLAVDGRGIHRVTLTEQLAGSVPGRKWVLYKLDEVGAPDVTVHFPDLSPDASPLVSGAGATTRAQISSFAWEAFPTFDPVVIEPRTFLWTDLGHEVEAYSHGADVLFTLL